MSTPPSTNYARIVYLFLQCIYGFRSYILVHVDIIPLMRKTIIANLIVIVYAIEPVGA